uniref:U2 small nuclear ribonucleoprotein auxiliary factor 35kDa subunit-related protein 2 n=1 Tax=Piromyces sp. TaxID=45796 RepID=A0A2S1TZM2_PIRSP|nr:U2 small nuclear ribonucleoprotein auxiliary factor 35kDa subunit-related protein 2 [Piromyces sp.]
MVKSKVNEINKELEKHRIEENFKYISISIASKSEKDTIPQASMDLFEIMGNQENNDLKICQFFKRTGACRFGSQCDRIHVKPSYSKTIIIRNMFDLGNEIMSSYLIDENEIIEYDEDSKDNYIKFKEFFDDVYPEFSKYGKIDHFYVCNNIIPHLRGNVYVDYHTEEEAFTAFCGMNGRWYGGKQLHLEFITISDWKMALCGTFLTI